MEGCEEQQYGRTERHQSMEGWVGQQYGRVSRPGEKLKCPVEIYLGASVSYGQYWTLHYPAHATMQAGL
jgi:hypothetical protein